ncbi:hypothetical protein [Nitrobacter sp.]|uniref:hypothetical protein n=1 Tax=Nitrobacter sp. TaxID=29420 RepID=UPI00399D72B8
MSLLEVFEQSQRARGTIAGARMQRQVADVVNRPKKRPGKRLRSSITMRAMNRPMSLLI